MDNLPLFLYLTDGLKQNGEQFFFEVIYLPSPFTQAYKFLQIDLLFLIDSELFYKYRNMLF